MPVEVAGLALYLLIGLACVLYELGTTRDTLKGPTETTGLLVLMVAWPLPALLLLCAVLLVKTEKQQPY